MVREALRARKWPLPIWALVIFVGPWVIAGVTLGLLWLLTGVSS